MILPAVGLITLADASYVYHPFPDPVGIAYGGEAVLLSTAYPSAGASLTSSKSVLFIIAPAVPGPLVPPLIMIVVLRKPTSHFVVALSALATTLPVAKLNSVNLLVRKFISYSCWLTGVRIYACTRISRKIGERSSNNCHRLRIIVLA
jgi:hypothetical protein